MSIDVLDAIRAVSEHVIDGESWLIRTPTLDLGEIEKRVIASALAETLGNRTKAAKLLGINVRTLRRKLNAPRRVEGERTATRTGLPVLDWKTLNRSTP